MHAKLLSRVQLWMIQWTVARQAPLSMGYSSQEYWSGLPSTPPRHLPNPGMEPDFPALAGGFFTIEPPANSLYLHENTFISHKILNSLKISK